MAIRLSTGATPRAVVAPMVLLALTTQFLVADEPQDLRPNIVLILSDDLGYGDVAALNSDSRIPTPNLDQLARESLSFTDAHSSGSYCVPSRYGLLTGRYMWRTRLGSGGNLANLAGTLIKPGRKTLADLLQDEGYFSGLVGKWHQGIDWKLHDESVRDVIRGHPNFQDFGKINFAAAALRGPKDYGFTYSFGTAGSAEMNPATFIANNKATIVPTLTSAKAREIYGEWYGRDDNLIAEGYTMDRLVPVLSDKACEFVETAVRSRPDQPFFLYYALTTPHNPVIPAQEFLGASQAGAYGDFVVELDHHVGRILHRISELGVAEKTIVIFTSDNGPVNRTRGYPARWVRGDTAVHGHDSTGPFRGWKGGLREGGHRVPFFVRWPGRIRPGTCSTTIVFNDVLPTIAEILKVRLGNNAAEDGHSFLPALTADQRPVSFHEAIVHNQSDGTFAVRQGSFKLMIHGPKTTAQVLDESAPATFALYDLSKDVEESMNIAADHPETVTAMHALLQKYIRTGRSVFPGRR